MYAVFFTWKDDGFYDTVNVEKRKELEETLSYMKRSGNYASISYERVYKNGARGARVEII